jgi:hypothetical protein
MDYRIRSVLGVLAGLSLYKGDRALLSRNKLVGFSTAGIRAVHVGSVRYYHTK